MRNKSNNINWDEIQKYYNEGNSMKDVCDNFNISMGLLTNSVKKK